MQGRPTDASRWSLRHAFLVDGHGSGADEAEPSLGPLADPESLTGSPLSAAELRWLHHLAIRRADHDRKRIERDLHDGVQLHLIQIAIKITQALDTLDAPEDDRRQALLDIRQQAQQALGAVRELCRGLYPSLLRDRGLVPALRALADRTGPGLVVGADDDVRALRLLPHVAEHLYFFVYEAVTNAWKHAGGGGEQEPRVAVSLTLADGEMTIAIRDDGCGFDPATVAPGHGLLTMEDRLQQLGGQVAIQSSPGQGTQVTGRLPVQPDHLRPAR